MLEFKVCARNYKNLSDLIKITKKLCVFRDSKLRNTSIITDLAKYQCNYELERDNERGCGFGDH